MAKATGPMMPVGYTGYTDPKESDTAEEPAVRPSDEEQILCQEIEQTREEMRKTMSQIQERLSPVRLRSQVLQQFHEAKETVKQELREDFNTIKESVSHEFQDAKSAVREATIGKVEHMFQNAADTVTETRETVYDTVRRNPVPAAMIGVGIAWLVLDARAARRQGRAGGARRFEDRDGLRERKFVASPPYRERYGEDVSQEQLPFRYRPEGRSDMAEGRQKISETVDRAEGAAKAFASDLTHDASQKASDMARDAGQKVSGLARDAGHKVSELAENARHMGVQAGQKLDKLRHDVEDTAVRLERDVERTLRESPVAAGAVAFGLGVGIGALLPRTGPEDRILGPLRDEVLNKAEAKAVNALQSAEHFADDAIGERRAHPGNE